MTRPSVVWLLILSLLYLSNCDPLTEQENLNRIDACGKSSTRKVYKGKQIDQSKAPWSVFILYNNQQDNSATTCTGTVVSPRHIITATHCFATLSRNGWLEKTKELHSKNCKDEHYIVEDDAILNKLLIQSNGAVVARSPERVTLVNGCERKTLMADENPQYEYEDYAIMELYEDLDMSSTIQMACVKHDPSPPAYGTPLEYNGFGIDPVDGDKMTTGTLRHESIRVLRGHPRNDSKRAFLASDPKNKSIACPGDSGGGAVSRDNGRITLVGVLSQTNCAQNNGVGEKPMELYSAVGYYNNLNCAIMGVCDDVNYHIHHRGYTRKTKPKRVFTTPAPKIIYSNQNGERISEETYKKNDVQVNTEEVSVGSFFTRSGNSKKYTITIIIIGVLFCF